MARDVTDEVDSASSLCWEQAGSRPAAMRGLLVYFTSAARAHEAGDRRHCAGPHLLLTAYGKPQKFRLADVILSVILRGIRGGGGGATGGLHRQQPVLLVAVHDRSVPAPYGLIASELGTAFPGDGGLYDWIQTALSRHPLGARASWYYWINFPLWMASLAVVCPERWR